MSQLRSQTRWAMASVALLAVAAPANAAAQTTGTTVPPPMPVQQAESQDSAVEPGSTLHVSLMTIGQGDAIWEKFGHNAIWIRDEAGRIDVAYNYGMFSFSEPGFVRKLMGGRMEYWMAGYDGTGMANAYVEANRSVWVQELNLRSGQRLELLRFLDNNAREENRYYRYDYFRDNCSTRVRDALNRVMGGDLQDDLEAIPSNETYRTHTQRLTADQIPANTGLLLAIGHPADAPLTAWDEGFIPMELMDDLRNVTVPGPAGPEPLVLSETELFVADRAPERTARPDRRIAYTVVGVLLGALLLGLARLGATRRAARAGFYVIATLWALAVGVFGTLITMLWVFTDHSDTFRNENLLQAGPLSLLLAGFLIALAFGRGGKVARALAIAIAGLAVLGYVLQVLPNLNQPNGEIIGLALPVHVAIAASLGWLAAKPAR